MVFRQFEVISISLETLNILSKIFVFVKLFNRSYPFFRNNLGYGHPVHVQPVRNNLRRPTSTHHFPPPRFQFQKGFASRCSWKCTAVVFILLSLVLTATLAYMTCKYSNLLFHVFFI